MSTTTRDNLETIIERVRKLLALSTSSNPSEAAAAAAKAQQLLLDYHLSMDQIGDAKTKARSDVTHLNFANAQPKNEGKWRSALIGGVARCYFCRAIDNHDSFILIGSKEDMEVTRQVYDWLVSQVLYLGPLAYKDSIASLTTRKPTFLRSFYFGATTTICNRLTLEWNRITGQTDNSRALVIRKAAQAQDYQDENFNTRPGRKASFSSAAGYHSGVEAGKGINLDGRGRKLGDSPKRLTGGN